MSPPVPTSLKTDEEWAAATQWLAHHGLIMHVPLRGQTWFERKEKDDVLRLNGR